MWATSSGLRLPLSIPVGVIPSPAGVIHSEPSLSRIERLPPESVVRPLRYRRFMIAAICSLGCIDAKDILFFPRDQYFNAPGLEGIEHIGRRVRIGDDAGDRFCHGEGCQRPPPELAAIHQCNYFPASR